MSHSEKHGPDHHAATGERPYFPAEDWQQFQTEDIAAGKAIIILISSIFSVGVVLYSIVAIAVGSSV